MKSCGCHIIQSCSAAISTRLYTHDGLLLTILFGPTVLCRYLWTKLWFSFCKAFQANYGQLWSIGKASYTKNCQHAPTNIHYTYSIFTLEPQQKNNNWCLHWMINVAFIFLLSPGRNISNKISFVRGAGWIFEEYFLNYGRNHQWEQWWSIMAS